MLHAWDGLELKIDTKLDQNLLLEPVFPEELELHTETMAGSFPFDSLGLGLASIGSPGDGGIHGGQVMVVIMVVMVVLAMIVLGYSQR